jgi:hypothetical protein
MTENTIDVRLCHALRTLENDEGRRVGRAELGDDLVAIGFEMLTQELGAAEAQKIISRLLPSSSMRIA